MFYHQKVAWVRVFANIQNFALRAHGVHGIPLVLEEKVMHCNIFFWVLTKLSWPRSLYSTRDELSESRFRAVQCYDDPTVAG